MDTHDDVEVLRPLSSDDTRDRVKKSRRCLQKPNERRDLKWLASLGRQSTLAKSPSMERRVLAVLARDATWSESAAL